MNLHYTDRGALFYKSFTSETFVIRLFVHMRNDWFSLSVCFPLRKATQSLLCDYVSYSTSTMHSLFV